MKLHLPYMLRRAVVRALFAAAIVAPTLASTTYADMITPDGRTATSVIQSGNVYNVYTNTVRGSTGFNSFSTFDVYADTTANLHLADGTGRLINVVRDSASHIDGVLNSYKGGRIGGDVYFLNPNGIFVGKTGVVNVGSISMSTPTAAFVEQLIARDGSISPTATQAVLAGDMPINEKGTISIKGKVNARNTVEMRAGKVEVKGGEINTGVKFREMVNTGKRKVDTKGMSIQGGKLSFGKKPAKARRAVAQAKERETEKKADIAIFADEVLVDGGDLNADWVYIDPDRLEFSNQAISGDYTLEARVIVLNNISVKQGETLTSFTLNAANELADGTFEGNVSITLSNSNITADRVDISATATTNAAEAAITISNSAIQTMLADNALNISATSESGNTSVNIQASSLTGAGDVEMAAVSLNGNAALTLGEASNITADIVTLIAGTITGDANVNVQGRITGGNEVNITATTGNVIGSEVEEIQDMEFTAEGGGNATVTVGGTVNAQGALTVAAIAQGTYGNATLNLNGKLSSLYTETKTVGELALERTQAETVLETDTEEQVNAKNAAYLERYARYLKTKETDTAATATIELAANASAGSATITQSAASELQASLSVDIKANAAQAASILLAGKTDSGNINAAATGETATLRVAEGATLAVHPHQGFTQDGTFISVSKNDGAISLEARARREDEPSPAPEPDKKDGVLLEVAGTLTARRETQDGAGEGGTISLASDGELSVTATAVLDASSAGGTGGNMGLDAPEYGLANPLSYSVAGTAGKGTIDLVNHEGITGDNINDIDNISRQFIKKTLNLSDLSDAEEWTSGFTLAKLSGTITLTRDVEASIRNAAIEDGTTIIGNGHSLTLTHSFLHYLSPTHVLTIGDDVTIQGVKDFTFAFSNGTLPGLLADWHVFTNTSLNVGRNFTVNASGNVTMAMEGYGNTYIAFKEGVSITAGGDVSISAKNTLGWGGSLGNTTPTDVLGTLVKMIPGASDTEVGKAFSKVGLVKFESGKFCVMVFNRLMGKENSKELLPQIGVRISKASVSFANEEGKKAGSIKGNTVTISSASTADLSGRQVAGSGGCAPLALSVGYIYNNSKVDLGRDLAITATGASDTDTSVSITSTTKSKLSLENCFSSNTKDYALGLLLSVGTDFNAVNVDKSVTITAEKDINIGTTSDISARPFMSLGSGWEKKVGKEPGKEYGKEAPAANNLFMLGVNLLVHTNHVTIDGSLTSNRGNIGMQSVDDIASTLTMSGSLQYTLGQAKEKKPDKEQNFFEYLGTAFRECIVIDLGIGKMRIDENFKKLIDQDNLAGFFKKGHDLFEVLADREAAVERSIALSIATDIVIADNNLQFNGSATAENGSVTLNAASSIEAACGAETSIVGLPSKQAVAGSISVPVLIGDTTVEIGSNANIVAEDNISVSSSTSLPMSFDLLGWRDWAKFVTDAGGNRTTAQFLTALRGSLQYVRDYKNAGDFGILNSLTSSHASTLMKGTGKDGEDTMTAGGDLVVDVRNLNTQTIIKDGAHLTAGGKLSATSSATGTQVTFAGQLPVFLTLCRPTYISSRKADSGFGGSIIVGEKTLNTVTYIGAATLEAAQLEVDATGDAFMMEMSVAGGFGSTDDAIQGGVNIIVDNKMTVSEISGDADITLTGEAESSITATDKSVLLNISGMEADGGRTAIGFGVAITVNNSFTAAMLGNSLPIGSAFEDNWNALAGERAMPFDRAGAITLNLAGYGNLNVEAANTGTLVNIGVSCAVQTNKGEHSPEAAVAANVGVSYNQSETTARQDGVTATNARLNDITTQATDSTTIVSVAGDAAVNTAEKNTATGAGAISINRGVMDTTAYVTDCDYRNIGAFLMDSNNTATVVAVDVAAGVGAATAGIAAGSAWNSLSGNTGSYLTGGSVSAQGVTITSVTDLTSFSCTLGAAVGIELNAKGQGDAAPEQDIQNLLEGALDENASSDLEESLSDINNIDNGNNDSLGASLAKGEKAPLLAAGNGVSFDLGASISRNALDMSSKAIVEGCTVTTPGELKVTAEDSSVITAVSVGAAFTNEKGLSVGAGGVFTFAPVSSTTEAAIRQKTGAAGQLDISAGSLVLHATDNHRERVWSFGGGYGETAGIGLVMTWGSFAGATTLALIENVNATVGSGVDILASSDLDTTYIAVGASASKGAAAVTGMLNYLNFNNQVITDIKDSTLTITDPHGDFKALSEGTRTFTDGFGDLSIRVGGKKPGAGIGGALSFIYVGGNGADDTNLTQMLVRNSTINNSGTTELLANSSTTGLLAGANAAITGGSSGLSFTGSFSWVSDASFTQVDIKDTVFNKRKDDTDKRADIKAEATSSSNLTVGIGSLSVHIGQGAGIGVSIAVLKDNATTAATMSGGGVESAHDFTLHASGSANLEGIVIGGAGSGLAGVSGGALASSVTHHVTAELKEAVMNMNGSLTIKADNTTNVGKDATARFTVANAAIGGMGVGVGVEAGVIDVNDLVVAHAHNVSVSCGSMDVLAEETANADAVAVNVAAGLYGAGNLNVVHPVLRGAADASITADRETLEGGKAVGITTTTGGLNVEATNTQWIRSHLWTFALAVNPLASAAANICVNTINLAGSANALIQGPMVLTLAGDMNVTADTERTATYTTVPVSGSLGLSLNIDVNSLRVSNDTSSLTQEEADNKGNAAKAVDAEIEEVCKLIESADIKLDADTKLTISGDVRGAMSSAADAADSIDLQPKTSAKVDLGGKTADVGGDINILATDTITTTPTTVPVTGGLLAVAPHFNKTTLEATVEATVANSVLNAGGNITIDARQDHTDNFHNVGVAIGAVSGTYATYDWTDTATTGTALQAGAKLKAQGDINIATHSDIKETFLHVNTGIALGNVAYIRPTFEQTETNTLLIGDGVTIDAQKAVTIGTNSICNLNVSTYDVTLAALNIGQGTSGISLGITQQLQAGHNVSITGSSVAMLQNIDRTFGITEDHINGSVLGFSFPFMEMTDTVNATLSLGDNCTLTARDNALTLASDVTSAATLSFLGVNGIGIGAAVAENSFTENIANKVKLGKNAKLRAEGGDMDIRARSVHSADMQGTNIAMNIANLADLLTTTSRGYVTSDVTIGTGFDAKGKSLTLEALNADEYLYRGEKVSVSLVLNPFSKNAFEAYGTSTANITLDGGTIDVERLVTRAQTDVSVKVTQLIGGGSITVDVNVGKVKADITQNATVTLGSGSNTLDILTDDLAITAHNKHLFTRLDESETMVYGGDVGLVSGNSKGTVDATRNINASVTLGSGSKIRRRADAGHYLSRAAYGALVSATNNVESNTEIELFSGGVLNANCILNTWDATTANATLTLNGSIDTWNDTELTAYSHVRHNMVNSVTSGAMIPTFTSSVKNTIDTADTVNINGVVESIGNITIQSGSAKGEYRLVDGTTVLAGDDDTNTTSFFWGKDDAVIHNKRKESLTINADVRAGGELAIYNDSSANTAKHDFRQTHGSDDYRKASTDTAATVTSTINLAGGAKLYAGLGSAIQMAFQGSDSNLSLQFLSAQRIFDGSEQQADGTWLAPGPVMDALARTYRLEGDTADRLGIAALTLPGMTFRIETKADPGVFAGKLYSPAKHGLDIFVASSWKGHVETTGATLLGYESGLFYNRKAVEGAVSACSGPDLYRSEGVSIRNQAQGDLYVSGMYDFPYSTLLASSDHSLIITGNLRCGNVTLNAGDNFVIDTPDKDQSLLSALQLYESLFNTWESTAQQNVKDHAANVVANSGKGGDSTQEGCYKAEDYKKTFTAEEIRKAAEGAMDGDGGVIRSSGTVTINARVVDLNGRIYSGLQDTDIVIAPDFKVQLANGKIVTPEQARELYLQDHSNSTFRLYGYEGIPLVYDAENNRISLGNMIALPSGIDITGIIVNSDPTGKSGLYVASGGPDISIDNQSAYTLNIGTMALSAAPCSGIRLQNTGTGETTTYTQNEHGAWIQRVDKGGSVTTTELGNIDSTSYDGTANYQVKLEKKTQTPVTEKGRLTFSGNVDGVVLHHFYNDGKVGTKETIIDEMTVNTGGTQTLSELSATYVAWDSKHGNGYAGSTHTLTGKELTRLYDPGTIFYRYEYTLEYADVCTNTLYINATNSVGIHFGGSGSGGSAFHVNSGDVNFSGVVSATTCTVDAGNAITAAEAARINAATVSMTASRGSIGSEGQSLTFNAGEASFSAGQNLHLATQQDIGKLALRAGKAINLHSDADLAHLEYQAGDAATIAAQGEITVRSGIAARTSLTSETGGIRAAGVAFSPGILTARAEQDISLSTTGALELDYVESRQGSVELSSDKGITSVRSSDLDSLTAVPGSTTTNLQQQAEKGREELSDEYYAKLAHYERLYYEQDGDGNYVHRDANGNFILPDEQETLAELRGSFKELYESGRGDYLGRFILSLSETPAVDGTTLANEADALAYLAQHADKLETEFARAYYDKLVADITAEVRKLHGKETAIDYGQFNEAVYHLYWMKDHTGKYVNQDADGNFTSPDQVDGFGRVIGKVYSDAACKAITAQFKGQRADGAYDSKQSALLGNLSLAASGYNTAATMLGQLKGSPAAVANRGTADNLQTTIRAKKSITLTTREDRDIGGSAFRFSIKPMDWMEDGTPVYSDWANAFMAEIKSGKRAGVEQVSEDKTTGERFYAMSYFEARESTINELEKRLLQQAVPSDIHAVGGIYRVYTRNYIGVDAPELSITGGNVLVSSTSDLNLGDGNITAKNLYLSTTGSISGSMHSAGGIVSIFAGSGIGAESCFFGISGGATYSLGSDSDVYLKTDGPVNLASLSGEHVTIDTRDGSLVPVLSTQQPNIIGRRIDFHGNLDSGLGFRTFGTTQENGGLHWHGGDSANLRFDAHNTAYTFWFVAENAPASLGQVDIGYSGHLVLGGLPEIQSAAFHQRDRGTGLNVLEFTGAQSIRDSLEFTGESSYTVLAPELLTLASGSTVNLTGNAALRLAGIANAQGAPIRINSRGNLRLNSRGEGATCDFRDGLLITGTGDAILGRLNIGGDAAITAGGDFVASNLRFGKSAKITANTITIAMSECAGPLLLNGANGVTGIDVAAPQIIANSTASGVFMKAITNDLSGSSRNSFVADLEPLQADRAITVHHVTAHKPTGKVVIRALANNLVLDGLISGSTLEFYNTGDIHLAAGVTLDSFNPLLDIWRANEPNVGKIIIDSLGLDLQTCFLLLGEESVNDTAKNIDDARTIRSRINKEDATGAGGELRFLDKNGNTVSREEYANLVTGH